MIEPDSGKMEPEIPKNEQSELSSSASHQVLPKADGPSLPRKSSFDELPLNEYIAKKVKERMEQARIEEEKIKAERERKRAEEKAKQDAIISSVRDTIARNKEVLSSTKTTIDNLHSTIEGLKETERRFEDFQHRFTSVMASALQRAFGQEEDVEEMKAQYGSPRPSCFEEVAMALAEFEKIVVIVGRRT